MKRTGIQRKTRLRSHSEKQATVRKQAAGRAALVRRKKVKARKPRKASERERIYGPKGRVEFVNTLPCAACSDSGRSDNHHIEGDGVGRKARYDKIIPLCRDCHLAWHRFGRCYVEKHGGFTASDAAAATERLWQAHTLTGTRE